MNVQDEKNLKTCKLLVNENTGGGTIKEVLRKYPELIEQIKILDAKVMHFQEHYYKLRNAIDEKLNAENLMIEALQKCLKTEKFNPNIKKPLRQTSLLDIETDEE